MYISYNWLKELVDFSYSPDELDKILTMLGVEVEEIVDYSKKYDKFFTAIVLKKEKHPNADKLSICEVDYGKEIRTVVCGASNVETGQKVILGLPGAIVPSSGFMLETRKVRDIESSGMICSQVELETGDDASGIWVLPEETRIGTALADFLNLNDVIMDVSLTPNKADCNSHLGIAREISAFNGNPIKLPVLKIHESEIDINDSMQVIIEDPEKCPRYTCRIIRGVTVKKSPDWLKQRLILIGLRPVNIIVDITNLVLMEHGQPLHAFDLKKISGNKIICKTALNGEQFKTLDSKERILDSSMLMICDVEKKIAVAGVMGGENSEITNETTDVLLESAFFNPSSIRKTSKLLGIQSDASYRFERGVDIDNLIYSLNQAASMIAELAGGTIDKGLIDTYPKPFEKLKLKLRYDRANEIIGTKISSDVMKDILRRLRFELINEDSVSCTVTVPYSRVDVSLEIDLIEEIARLYNYNNIEPDYSISVSMSGESIPEKLAIPPLKKILPDYLVKKGFHEIITQNMMDPAAAKIFSEINIEISNPLGEELSIMRPSLVPAMLRTIERNIRSGSSNLSLFEIGKSFHKVEDDNTFIKGYYEKEELIIAICGKKAPLQWGFSDRKVDFFDLKGIVEELFDFFRFKNFKMIKNENHGFIFSKNSLVIQLDKNQIGSFGEVSSEILKYFDIENPVYLVEIDFSKLIKAERETVQYAPVSLYPGITRDLGFVVDRDLSSSDLQNEITNKGGKLLKSVNVFDIYEGKSIEKGKKNIAFSLCFSADDRTLKEDEIETHVQKIIKAVENKYNGQLRKF